VAVAFWPSESVTEYVIGVAVPVKVESGVKVIAPVVALTVYVPSLAIVKVVSAQFVVVPAAQSFTLVASKVVPVPAVSLVSTVFVCAVL
jgi:hypothetical protein